MKISNDSKQASSLQLNFTKISPPTTIRPPPELDSSHVVNVSCLTIQNDAYDPSLDAIMTITPCLINPADGATYTYRPWRSVGPCKQGEEIANISDFDTILVTARG